MVQNCIFKATCTSCTMKPVPVSVVNLQQHVFNRVWWEIHDSWVYLWRGLAACLNYFSYKVIRFPFSLLLRGRDFLFSCSHQNMHFRSSRFESTELHQRRSWEQGLGLSAGFTMPSTFHTHLQDSHSVSSCITSHKRLHYASFSHRPKGIFSSFETDH